MPSWVLARVPKSTAYIFFPSLEATYSCPLPKAKPYGSVSFKAFAKDTKVATVPEFTPSLPPVMMRMQKFELSAT